ncbi:Serpentine Receptor, class H [Caenorhabditis elegans]|uniref:Serpentine Receptor, class H n=1 Tax=Caenorhabditis elegans TaxID=6239 RepID=Q9N5I7_CAEEL|nr:Serpentine Receptor, class H [Caenorhabditis elegans]CCD61374.1 Serpentine Receptor, class H [Caenorhabditis elegans]|eukprot:NP_504117.1 Serpentine Receptor, class H [Caenorhabditis elegans]
MLNCSCSFEEPFGYTIVHYICTSISFPVYGLSIWILIFRTPSNFSDYRKYLVLHIFSGLLLEVYMGIIWKVTVVLPIPIMCSNSFTAEYAPIIFLFLPACLIYTGISIISLFVYRMEAVVIHASEGSIARRCVMYLRYMFFICVVFVCIFTILSYPDLKHQNEYKLKMEQRFGQFQPYMWCDNCFFFNFDSTIFKLFYVICAVTVVTGTTSATIAFGITIKCINSVRTRLSAKTKQMHRNFLISLLIAAAIHGGCILIPLLGFLWAISFVVSLSQCPYFPYILVLIIQEHGAVSTITMFLSNNLLRKALMRMLMIPESRSSNNLPSQNLQSTNIM